MRKFFLLIACCAAAFKGMSATYINVAGTALNNAANWTSDGLAFPDGTNTQASNFVTNGDIFNLNNDPGVQAWIPTWTLGAAASTVVLNINFTTSPVLLSGGLTLVKATSSLTTASGATLDMATFALTNAGTFTNAGTIRTAATGALPIPTGKAWTGAGTVEYYGSGSQTIVVGTYSGNLTISGSRAGQTLTLANGLVTVGNALTYTATGSPTFVNTGNTIAYGLLTGGVTIPSGISYNILSSGNTSGTNTTDGALSVAGNLTLGGGAGGVFDDGGNTVTVGGNLTMTGSHTGSGEILMTASGATLTGTGGTGNVELNNAGGFSLAGNTTVTGTMKFTAGKLSLLTRTLTLGAGASVTGMSGTNCFTSNGATSAIAITATGNVGTVYFDQTTNGTTNKLATLTLNGAGAQATLGNALQILTTLALTNGTLNDNGFVITCLGNITGTGTHTSSPGGEILMTGTAKSLSGTLGNVELNAVAASAYTIATSPLTINGQLTFTSAASTVTIGAASTLVLNGTVSGMSATKFFAGSATSNLTLGNSGALGTIFMSGVAANLKINNLIMNGGGSVTLGNAMTVVTAMTLTTGQFAVAPGVTLTLSGSFSGNSSTGYLTGSATSGLITGAASTFYFDQTSGGVSNNFSTFTASAGTTTLGNNLSVGALTLTGTVADGSNTLTVTGNITGAGVHSGLGEILMTGSASQISGITTGNVELNTGGTTTLTGSPTLNGTLTFTSGTLVLGANTLNIPTNGSVTGMSGTNFITCNGLTSAISITSTGNAGTFWFDQSGVGTSNKLATLTLNGNGAQATIGNALQILTTLALTNANSTLNDGGNVITVAGNITGSGTHVSGAGGEILMTGTNKSLSGTLDNVELNDAVASAYTIATSPLTINGLLKFTGAANTLTIAAAQTLKLNGTVSGMSGTQYFLGSATSNLTLGNSGALGTIFMSQAGNGVKISNLTMTGGGSVALGNPMNVVTAMTLTSGAFAINPGVTLTVSGTFSGNSSNYITGSATSGLITGTSSTYWFDQTTPGTSNNFSTFTTSANTTTLGNNLNVAGTLTLTALGTLADNGNVITMSGVTPTIAGTGIHTSTGAGKISMTGTTGTITGACTLGNLEYNCASATAFTLGANPTINGALTFTGANNTLTLGAHTLILKGTVAMSSTQYFTANGASSNLTIGSAGSLGAIYLNQTTPNTTNKITTFLMNGGGTASMGNNMVAATLTLTSGQLSVGANTLTVTGAFTGNSSNYLTGSASSVLNTGTAATYWFDQTTPGISNNFSSVTLTTGLITTCGNALSAGGIAFTTTAVLADGNNTITCTGNLTGTGSHTGGGKISMTGSGSSMSALVGTGNLELNNAGGFSLAGSPTVTGTLTFTAGKLAIGANTLTLGVGGTVTGMSSSNCFTGNGASSNLAITNTTSVGTVFFDQGTPGVTDNIATLNLNAAGAAMTLGSNMSILTALALTNATSSLNDGGFVISNAGNITGAGTHISGAGGKISMTGLNKSIASGAATYGNLELNYASGTSAFTMTGSPIITGTLTFAGANNRLTIGATTLTLAGTVSGMSSSQYFTCNNGASSAITVTSAGNVGTLFFDQTTPGNTNSLKTFAMNGAGALATMGNSMKTGALTLTSGQLTVGANTLTVTAAFTGSSSNYITGGASSALITGTSSTYWFDQTTPGTSNNFSTFTASAGTTTLGNNLSVSTTLTLTGTLADNGNVITVSGNLAGAGTHTSGAGGKISMTGLNTSIAGGAATYGNLELNYGSGASAFTMAANPTITGALTFTGANNTLALGTSTLILAGTVSGMSSTQYFTCNNGASSAITVTSTGALGTLFFNPGTPGNTDNLKTLTINGAGGTTTLGNALAISTTLALTAGTLADNGNVITNAGVITGTGTHTSGAGGKITMTGQNKSIANGAATYGNLELNYASGVSAFTMTGSPTVTGALTFTGATNTLAVGANTLTLNGTVSGMSVSKYITGGVSSNLTIGAGSALGTLFFNPTTPGTTNNFATFTMNGAGSATLGNALSASNTLALTAGTVNNNGVAISLAGNITGTGTESGSGTITMTASGATISGATISNVALNNAGGFSLTGNPTITGTLTLTAGRLTLGSDNLVLSSTANAVAGALSSSNMIIATGNGQVQKQFTGTGSYVFPVGDASPVYSPITVNFTGGTFGGGAYAGVNVTASEDPHNANTGTDAYLKRYWTVATSGITSPVYTITNASYVPGDVANTEGNLALGVYNGSLPWLKVAGSAVNTALHFLSATGSINNTNVEITGVNSANPSVNITSPGAATMCSGATEELDANGIGDPTLTYTWAPSTGLSATTGATVIASPTVAVTTAFVYTVTITDGNGDQSTNTYTLNVTPAVTAAPSNDGPICNSGTVNLNANGGGAASAYSWSGPNLSSSTVAAPSAAPTATATYSVTVSDGTTNAGCVLNLTTSVTVNVMPAAAPSNNGPICIGGTVNLSANAGGTVTTYAWSGPNLSSTTIANPTCTPTATATYSVTVASGAASGCSPATVYTTAVTVSALPDPGVISGSGGVCIGSNTTLSETVGGGTWSMSGSIASVDGTGKVTGIMVGSDNVTYTVSTSPSCTNSTNFGFNVEGITSYIYTVAGNGTAGYTGDNGPALSAEINIPRAMAVDASGNMYFCEAAKNVVRKVSASGIITTLAGTGIAGITGDGGQATAAKLNGPNGVCVDHSGNVLISNTASSVIRKVNTSTGIITTVAGTGTAGYSGDGGAATAAKLNFPLGLCVDASNNIYIADQDNYRIRRVDAITGDISTIIGYGSNDYDGDGGQGTAARISYSRDVQADNVGNLYVADCGNDVVRKYVISTGIITTLAGTGGAVGYSGDGGPATAAVFNTPAKLAFDGSDKLYVTDQLNYRIRQIDLSSGIISSIGGTGSSGYGGDAGAATSATLTQPSGLGCDGKGNLFFADAQNHVIRGIPSPASVGITLAGPTTVLTGTTINFTAYSSYAGNISYQWQINGSDVSGATNSTYSDASPVNGNVYTCNLTATPECGSGYIVTSNSITVTVFGPPPFVSTQVRTPGEAGTLSVFPNPVQAVLNLQGSGFEDGGISITVYDQVGRAVLIQQSTILGGNISDKVDMQSLAAGMYMVALSDKEGKIAIVKVVKQ